MTDDLTLAETLKRVMSRTRVDESNWAIYRCRSCLDTGWVTFVKGEFRIVGGNDVVASERHPVLRRCSACKPVVSA